MVCIHFGMPRQPVNRELLTTADWAGILYASVGFSLIYAALDQGNRLDWLNSGLINALLLGGGLVLVAFVVQELVHDRPWINLHFVVRGNLPLIFFFITFFRFAILSTSLIIPQYLTTVQNYRAMEIGGVLVWIALPQLLLAPVVATILRFVDARLMMAFGFALVGGACFMAGQLTHDWVGADFLPSQILQAVGQSFGLTSLVWFALKHLEPTEVLTFGAADCAPVRGRTRYGLCANLHTGERAGLLEPRRAARHHGFRVDGPAAKRLCAGRDGTLGWPSRGQCACDRAPRPCRAGPSVCAGLY
jgi:DHA2 family multidrug resistance protein